MVKWNKESVRIFSRHPSHNSIRNKIYVPRNKHIIFRLGSLSTPRRKADLEINTVESIQNTMNKITMKKLFYASGVKSPEFYLLYNDVGGIYEDNGFKFISFEDLSNKFNYPILAKKTYRSRGRGMKKLDTKEEFLDFIENYIKNNRRHHQNPYYIEEYKNYTKEYRIHCSALGGYFYTCRKMLKGDAEDRWYRNDSNSTWFLEDNPQFDKPETWDQIVEDCNNARKALGLFIGGADVRVNKKGEHMIIEMNSACSLGEKTALAYIRELEKIVKCCGN